MRKRQVIHTRKIEKIREELASSFRARMEISFSKGERTSFQRRVL